MGRTGTRKNWRSMRMFGLITKEHLIPGGRRVNMCCTGGLESWSMRTDRKISYIGMHAGTHCKGAIHYYSSEILISWYTLQRPPEPFKQKKILHFSLYLKYWCQGNLNSNEMILAVLKVYRAVDHGFYMGRNSGRVPAIMFILNDCNNRPSLGRALL